MKSTALVVLTGLLGLISSARAVDYCSSNYTCDTSPNIGCNNTGALGPDCPAGTVVLDLTTDLKQAIVGRHNTRRNTLAAGSLPGFQPAVKMATMRWNNELALLASYNAKRCEFGHDACRKTLQFPWAGQNIALSAWTNNTTPDNLTVILGLIDSWWSEYANTTMADVNAYPTNPTYVIGHFLGMAGNRNTAVGCSVVLYPYPPLPGWNALLLVCNYARTNMLGEPTYIYGPSASKCTTGTNPNFSSLCSVDEVYNVKSP